MAASPLSVERDLHLGDLLAQRLTDRGWLRINHTALPVVCVLDAEADALGAERSAAWHAAVVDRVVRSGAAWISLVRLTGRPAVRLCVTSHRTRVADVDAVAEARRAA